MDLFLDNGTMLPKALVALRLNRLERATRITVLAR
jgi:hypothetical protein